MCNSFFEQIFIPESKSFNCNTFTGNSFFCPIHNHPECEMVFIAKGEIETVVGNSKYRQQAGELLLVGPHIPHGFSFNRTQATFTSHYIQIKTRLIENSRLLFSELSALNKISEYFEQGAIFALDAKLTALYFAIFEQEGSARLMAWMPFLQSLSQIQPQRLLTEHYQQQSSEAIHPIVQCIKEHIRAHLSLAEISEKMNMSISTFTRVIQQNIGLSYVEYLTSVKVDLACRLLSSSVHPITYVASESGFTSISQFNKKFKQHVGASPSEYRKEWRDIYSPIMLPIKDKRWDMGEIC